MSYLERGVSGLPGRLEDSEYEKLINTVNELLGHGHEVEARCMEMPREELIDFTMELQRYLQDNDNEQFSMVYNVACGALCKLDGD
jgi:hypothetical protein